jgi:hypothetical protein
VICRPCRQGRHTLCRLGNWCDCQHRFTPEELEAEVALRELTQAAQDDKLGDHGSDL